MKSTRIIGQNFTVGDVIFGEGEMGYIARKIASKDELKFKIRLTSQTECLILNCSGAELYEYVEEGVWKCRSPW